MGKNSISKFTKKACEILGIPPKGYTTHCWRRSAATNLADEGVSFVNLKRHGQWASDSVVEGYIANSKILRTEREQKLLPRHRRNKQERESLEERTKTKVQELNLLEDDFWDQGDDAFDGEPMTFGFSQMDAPMEYQGATESGIPLFKQSQETVLSSDQGKSDQGNKESPTPPKTESNFEPRAAEPKKDPTALMKSMMQSIMESSTKTTGNVYHNCVFNFLFMFDLLPTYFIVCIL